MRGLRGSGTCARRLIEGGLPTERLGAQVLTARYADHTPLFRQAQALARHGVQVSRSVLAIGPATPPPS